MATRSEKHPEVYVRGKVDPRQRVRTVPMEVLSLGYSRTGTMSTYTYAVLLASGSQESVDPRHAARQLFVPHMQRDRHLLITPQAC
jgi:hypothetical protein